MKQWTAAVGVELCDKIQGRPMKGLANPARIKRLFLYCLVCEINIFITPDISSDF